MKSLLMLLTTDKVYIRYGDLYYKELGQGTGTLSEAVLYDLTYAKNLIKIYPKVLKITYP